ncbi:uncharacterized protein LOC135160139 [Diachasmimorpha longicaudata]|uniref:uncharacterized protein LOC135160139 n=1 Tax=Diachasmimorpha longicaudata TaxID=58733 RepID=UPI0030B8A63B
MAREKHFLREDMMTTYKLSSTTGQTLRQGPIGRPKLRDGAVPLWLPWTEVSRCQLSCPDVQSSESPEDASVKDIIHVNSSFSRASNSESMLNLSVTLGEMSTLSFSACETSQLALSSQSNTSEAVESNLPFTFDDE